MYRADRVFENDRSGSLRIAVKATNATNMTRVGVSCGSFFVGDAFLTADEMQDAALGVALHGSDFRAGKIAWY